MRTMEITTRIGCSNMCKFCPQKLFVGEYRKVSHEYVMSFELFKTAIDKIPKDVHIIFAGMTEPWLNRDCTKMMLYAYNSGHKDIGVYTTCVGLTLDDIEQIKHIPFLMFVLHLADKERNALIPVTPQYMKVLETLKTIGIHNISYMTMGELHPKLVPLLGDVTEAKRMLSRAGNLGDYPAINHKGPITCNSDAGLKHNVLMPNGDVVFCCMDYAIQHTLGNLLTNSYEDLFHAKEFTEIVKRLKDDNAGDVLCRHCEYAVPDDLKWKLRPVKKFVLNTLVHTSHQ